jgi:hypothetical protein
MKTLSTVRALFCVVLTLTVMCSGAQAGGDIDYSNWSADPTVAGANLPPVGRSLFDTVYLSPSPLWLRAFRANSAIPNSPAARAWR